MFRIALALAVCLPLTARADLTHVGVSGVVGGGVTEQSSETGVLWSARVTLGSRLPLALELGYLGSSTHDPHGGTLDADTLDATVRYALLPGFVVSPYAFAGLSWQHVDLSGAHMTPSLSLQTVDDAAALPVGVGVSIRPTGSVIVDVRGTYRASRATIADIDAWEATAGVGIEL